MKLKFWQKLYLSTLLVFLVFFNSGIFVIVTSQNSRALNQQKDNLLTQQEYILQQIVNDMTLVYQSRPLGLPFMIEQYGNRYLQKGVLMQIKNGESMVYSSFSPGQDFTHTGIKGRTSEIDDVNENKYFMVRCNLPEPFTTYSTVLAFPVQEFFDNWNNTVFFINLLCCVVSAVTAIVLYNLLKHLTKPIQSLNDAAIRFGKGELDARIEYITDDEIGETAQNFNIMAQQICSQMQVLENTAKEKQSFIDDFSHEMRTPLTAIRGYSQYMQRAKITDDEYYNTLEIIDHNAGRLQNLSESMLALSLSEQDKGIEFVKVYLARIFENLKYAYRPKLDKNNIEFTYQCEENLHVNGDAALLESLIGNLIDNAINACNADETKEKHFVKLYTESGDNKVWVAVEDNGIGMDKDTLEKVHRPFYRQDKARSRKNGGAGLGGAITKKIADMHGAKIVYHSQPGKGTVAAVEFTT